MRRTPFLLSLLISAAATGCALRAERETEDVAVTTEAVTWDNAELKPLELMDAGTGGECLRLQETAWTSAYANPVGISAPAQPVPLSTILTNANGELNRSGVLITSTSRMPEHPANTWKYGFEWDSGDQSVTYWAPQGMALSMEGSVSDAFVAWDYGAGDPTPPANAGSKGVRVSIAKLDPIFASPRSAPLYRHTLLVQSSGSTSSVYTSVAVHAGGLVVRGSFLYVADTSNGIRVFDLGNIREVSTVSGCGNQVGHVAINSTSLNTYCAFGYRYVIPQVSWYRPSAARNECLAKFSFLGEDNTQSPNVVLSGEYCNNGKQPCPHATPMDTGGRLYRWPLASNNHLVASNGIVTPTTVYRMNKRNVQGVAPVPQTSARDDYRLSSTRTGGALFYVSPSMTSKTFQSYNVDAHDWPRVSQGLHASSTGSGNLWVNTEGDTTDAGVVYTNPSDGGRVVYALDSNNLYPP
jgi:hypothetical protein